MLNPKKVSQLSIVFAIVNYEIGALVFFERPYVITTTQRVSSVDGGGGHAFGRSHFHMGACQRKNQRHRRRRRRSGIEVGRQPHGESRIDHFTRRWILIRSKRVN